MKYLLRYTPEAARDMMDVWDGVYEASKDYDTANKYADEFRELIADKKQFPFSGVMVKYRGLFTGFYTVRYKKYFAFYRVQGNNIEVVRIIMAKRDFMKILFGDAEE